MCADKQSTDWFHTISCTLKWNEREHQKSFIVVKEGPAKEHEKRMSTPAPHEANVNAIRPFDDPPKEPEKVENRSYDKDEDEASDGEGLEDDFDITYRFVPQRDCSGGQCAEVCATLYGENSPPESSWSSSTDSSTTSTCTGADTDMGASVGPRIADLGGK